MTGPSPGIPLEQQPGPVVSRLNVYAEAQGEGPVGMAAVWWVVEHRAGKRMTTRQAEILRPQQFSWTLDPKAIRKAINAHRDDPVVWAVVDTVCALCEAGLVTDPTGGADHYLNRAHADPRWARVENGWQKTTTIGAHEFGRCA